jgi:hypothetical protein
VAGLVATSCTAGMQRYALYAMAPALQVPISIMKTKSLRIESIDVSQLAAVTGGSGGSKWTDAEERRDDKIMRERKRSPRSIGAM